jgi:hypothetical protein
VWACEGILIRGGTFGSSSGAPSRYTSLPIGRTLSFSAPGGEKNHPHHCAPVLVVVMQVSLIQPWAGAGTLSHSLADDARGHIRCALRRRPLRGQRAVSWVPVRTARQAPLELGVAPHLEKCAVEGIHTSECASGARHKLGGSPDAIVHTRGTQRVGGVSLTHRLSRGVSWREREGDEERARGQEGWFLGSLRTKSGRGFSNSSFSHYHRTFTRRSHSPGCQRSRTCFCRRYRGHSRLGLRTRCAAWCSADGGVTHSVRLFAVFAKGGRLRKCSTPKTPHIFFSFVCQRPAPLDLWPKGSALPQQPTLKASKAP